MATDPKQLFGRVATLLRAADTMAAEIVSRQLIEAFVRNLEPDTPLALAAAAYLSATGLRERLVTAEAMADEVESLVDQCFSGYYYLDARSGPADALLDYRNPSGRKCGNCGRPEAHFWFNGQEICTKCFIDHLPD